jgi:hypothetical protein
MGSIAREPQCAKPGGLLTNRLLGRIVLGRRFSSLTHLFLLLKQCFRAYALGCLICSQLDLLVELALEGMHMNALPHLLFQRHYRALQHRPAEMGP